MAEEVFLSIDTLLTETCSVQKTTTSSTSAGGVVNTFTNRIASLKCLLNQRRRRSEAIEFGKVTNRDENILFTEYNTSAATIVESDRIVSNSRTFEVIKTPYDPGNRNSHFQIELEEIT